jgi:hypothetical protein
VARRILPIAAAILALAVPVTLSRAEVSQQGTLRVSFGGKLSPSRLPRSGFAPITVSLSGEIKTTDESTPPQLQTIRVAINRFGRLDAQGLPRCHYHQIQPASTAEAREACAGSLIGSGHFEANVALPEQSPFPSNGKVLGFNGTLHGDPVIYVHIYGTEPVPISQLLPFSIHHIQGTYRTLLSAHLPQVAAEWGYVSGLSLTLARRFRYHGQTRSYLSAGCPAPSGFSRAVFPFARVSFGFDDGRTLSNTLTRRCTAR